MNFLFATDDILFHIKSLNFGAKLQKNIDCAKFIEFFGANKNARESLPGRLFYNKTLNTPQ
jgi:hypothetical protein